MKPFPPGRRFLRPLTLVLPLALAGFSHAADVTWSPTPADGLWSNGANWSSSPAAPVATDVLFFGPSTTTALNNDLPAATTFNGINFATGSPAFTISGNSVTLGGNVTNSSTSLQEIDIPLVSGAATRTFTTNAGGGDITVGGVVSGGVGVGLAKSGVGTLTLKSANTYPGTTFINAGTVAFGSASLPSLTQSLGALTSTVGADASVVSVLGSSGNASLTFTGAQTGTDGSALNYVVSGGVNGVSNQIRLPAGTPGFQRSRIFFNGGDYAFLDAGAFLRAPNYGGDANFSIAAGFLVAGHNLVTTSIVDQAAITINTLKFGGTGAVDLALIGNLTVGTGFGASAGGILRSGGGTTTISGGSITNSPGTLYNIRTDTSADVLNISSNILASSVNPLVKTGAGALVLGGVNNYSGTTYVDNGMLVVNGSHVSGTGLGYNIYPGAMLAGTGLISIQIPNAINVNGILAPGDQSLAVLADQTGTLDIVDPINLNAGSTLGIQLGGNTPGDGVGFYDQVNMTAIGGAVTLVGNVTLSLSLVNGYVPAPGDAFYFLTRLDIGTYAGEFNGLAEGASFLLGGQTVYITYLANWDGSQATSTLTGGNDMAIYALPVPEPGSLALAIFGMAAVTISLRRRRASR